MFARKGAQRPLEVPSVEADFTFLHCPPERQKLFAWIVRTMEAILLVGLVPPAGRMGHPPDVLNPPRDTRP